MDKIFELLKEKGVIFILMGLAIIYFHTQNEALNLKVDKMHLDNTTQSRAERKEMLEIINNNTFVMESNTKVMESIKKHLERSRKN